MPDYKVITAEHKKDVTTDKGAFQVIALALDANGVIEGAEWFAKKTTAIPAPGDILTGTLEQSQYGKKFKRAPAGFGGGPRQEDPKRQAMIVRQHSQTAAISLLQLMHTIGVVDMGKTKAEVFQTLTTTIDWLDTDAKQAGERA